VAFLASEICELELRCESLTRSLLEGNEGEGRGQTSLHHYLPSFILCPHAGLCHQGQRPRTVEATVLTSR
jgi:hypothetical protein